ncbi:MAG: ParB/RepB/Spo0J family partition protein [Rikenellaceae bacterium]|nr:ParB/RepB/Spo0J family partition protein [Rikenellaceae bacterium]
MKTKPKGLGRGLESIFDMEKLNVPEKLKESGIDEIDIEKLVPNTQQPRKSFDDESLNELAESIKHLGIIQPLTVNKGKDGKYLIISGERRYRASKIAGLTKIPAYIREVNDQTLLEMSLVENIQREDLNAIEIAISLQRLVDECDMTQENLAERVGKKRSTVANYLRLLKLPAEIQVAIKQELISMGHARALINIESKAMQLNMLKRIIKNNLSVRQVEEIISNLKNNKINKKEVIEEEYPKEYIRLVEHLESFFNQDIAIKKGNKGKGKIIIEFKSDEDILTFLKKFESIRS